jgi:hypothetical protein
MVEVLTHDQAILLDQLSGVSRKFIIEVEGNKLYICAAAMRNGGNADHETMACNLKLSDTLKGGILSVANDRKITFTGGSSTTHPATEDELKKFNGEIIVFNI